MVQFVILLMFQAKLYVVHRMQKGSMNFCTTGRREENTAALETKAKVKHDLTANLFTK